MGQLVFQATLGGAVNLIGPNTASTINFTLPSADGTSGQALATNGTGTLAFSSFATLVSNTFTGSQTLSAGTANGVTYLNGSKVLTSGSALTFDGTNVGVGAATPSFSNFSAASSGIEIKSASTFGVLRLGGTNGQFYLASGDSGGSAWVWNYTNSALIFGQNNTEGMRLTSTGLVVGATSATAKLTVINTSDANKQIVFSNNASYYGSVGHNAGNGLNEYRTEPSGGHGFFIGTSSTANVTIDSSGSLLVGTTTDPTTGALARGIVSIKQLNDTSQTSGLQIEANANTTLIGIGYNGSTFAIGTTYRSTGSYVPISLFTSGSERARITNDGEVLVGTTTVISPNPGISLAPGTGSQIAIGHGNGSLTGTYYAYFVYNGTIIGSITQSGTTAVLYNTTSDQRLKENIVDADSASSLIDSLKVRQFDWKADGSHQRYGFVAQELVTVAPEAVNQPNDPDEMMAVDYSKLVPMLVKEIQSLRVRVAQLETN